MTYSQFKNLFLLSMVMLVLGACGSSQQNNNSSDSQQEDDSTSTATEQLKPDDWKLGVQAWTFHLNTLEVALKKMDSCNLTYLEGFPGQEIGNGIEGKLDYHMNAEKRKEVKKMLADHGVKMVSYGVVVPKTKADWEQLFKFADAMDLDNIASEPERDQIPLVSKLADKYEINVAIHNHSDPTPYWHPDSVLDAIAGASPRIGACADIGHWLESGLDPVECLKQLEGHIIEFHIKDENKKGGENMHDVPMGDGVIDFPAILKETKRQGFKGYMFVEHEYHFKNNVPEVIKGVKYFRQEKAKILGGNS